MGQRRDAKNRSNPSSTREPRARGVGVGERVVNVEGGGDGESTAITEDGCAIGTRSRALGLEAGTDTTGGAGGFEGAGMGARRRRRGAEAFVNWPRDESGGLTTSRRNENMTRLTRAKG